MRKNRSVAAAPERDDTMQLVERHVISKNDPRYTIIDAAAFASKNLWNAANYLVRQASIHERVYLEFAVHPVRMTLMKHTKHVAVMRALMLQSSVIPARIIVSIS